MRLSAAATAGDLAAALPQPFNSLERAGIALRHGQFSCLAAAPGVGKTLFAHNYALAAQVPTLYFSADSDQYTVTTRTIAIVNGTPLDVVNHNYTENPSQYVDDLRKADNIDWCFDADITPQHIAQRLSVYAELHGAYPDLIVVDNLGNSVQAGTDEFGELREVVRDIQRVARHTNAHVMALHHVKGAFENGNVPITLGALINNLGKIPEVVLGLHRDSPQSLGMTVPKNRGGKAGLDPIPLLIDYERATIGG